MSPMKNDRSGGRFSVDTNKYNLKKVKKMAQMISKIVHVYIRPM